MIQKKGYNFFADQKHTVVVVVEKLGFSTEGGKPSGTGVSNMIFWKASWNGEN